MGVMKRCEGGEKRWCIKMRSDGGIRLICEQGDGFALVVGVRRRKTVLILSNFIFIDMIQIGEVSNSYIYNERIKWKYHPPQLETKPIISLIWQKE